MEVLDGRPEYTTWNMFAYGGGGKVKIGVKAVGWEGMERLRLSQ